MKRTLWTLLVSMSLISLSAQQTQPKITMAPVAGPVYVLQGGGGNIAVVADSGGIFMIDAMEEPLAAQIRNLIKDLPGGGRVRVLLNTHWHADHTGGNKAFGPEASILSQENVRSLLSKDQDVLGRTVKALPASALPNITFSDKLTAYAGGEMIRLVHYPNAHTDGDSVAFFDHLKIVHMGDMFFNRTFPFLDVANGGDIDNWVRELDVILAALPPDAKIIPGHGAVCGPEELRSFRQMLADSAEIVRKEMQAGKKLEEIKAAGLPARFSPWARGFMDVPRWLELVYRSLEKHK